MSTRRFDIALLHELIRRAAAEAGAGIVSAKPSPGSAMTCEIGSDAIVDVIRSVKPKLVHLRLETFDLDSEMYGTFGRDAIALRRAFAERDRQEAALEAGFVLDGCLHWMVARTPWYDDFKEKSAGLRRMKQ